MTPDTRKRATFPGFSMDGLTTFKFSIRNRWLGDYEVNIELFLSGSWSPVSSGRLAASYI